MTVADHVFPVDAVIGMPILSRVTGNKLGTVHDLIIDPLSGNLGGVVLHRLDGSEGVLHYGDISSFGKDAVMAHADDVVSSPREGELTQTPCTKRDIVGAQIITEDGNLIGRIANIHVHLAPPPIAIYEVRESLLDKILGRVLYVPASFARALSGDAERILVPDDALDISASTIGELADRFLAPLVEEETRIRAPDPGTLRSEAAG
jgi:uncharacterized protein YrrD